MIFERSGQCAQDVGVKIIDSLDEHGQETFHPLDVAYMLDKSDKIRWLKKRNHFPLKRVSFSISLNYPHSHPDYLRIKF